MELQLTTDGLSTEIQDDNARQTRVTPMTACDITERNGIWLQIDSGDIACEPKRQRIEH